MPKKKWSKEIVIASIQKIYQSGGKLNSNYAQRHRRKLYLAAYVYLGNWKKAIEASDLSYDDVRILEPHCRKWSKGKIISRIQKLHCSGKPINSNFVQVNIPRLYHAAVIHFGGWRQAVEVAGFDYALVRIRTFRSWSKEAVAKAIWERSKQALSLNGLKVSEEDRGLYQAAKRYIGSWKKALRFAGIDPRTIPDPRKKWTKEKIRDEILLLHKSGVPLNVAALLESEHKKLMSVAQVYFGSWRKAIRFSGLRYAAVKKIRMRWWTPKRVLYIIRRLEKAGVRLSSKSIRQSRGGLFQAAIAHFGNWSQAVEATGIDYAKHSKVWSSKAWVRKLTNDDLGKIDRQSIEMSRIRRGG